MGCLESRPKQQELPFQGQTTLSLDDFKVQGEDAEAKVDKESIKALWEKWRHCNPRGWGWGAELTSRELSKLTPSEPITEANEDKFPEFKEKLLKFWYNKCAEGVIGGLEVYNKHYDPRTDPAVGGIHTGWGNFFW